MSYIPVKEKAAAIRKELKQRGITARDVSVRSDGAGLEDAIRITVKSPTVDIREVAEIAGKYRDVSRCEASGEILSGCNTFVFVEYEYGVFEEAAKPYLEEAKDALAKVEQVKYGV